MAKNRKKAGYTHWIFISVLLGVTVYAVLYLYVSAYSAAGRDTAVLAAILAALIGFLFTLLVIFAGILAGRFSLARGSADEVAASGQFVEDLQHVRYEVDVYKTLLEFIRKITPSCQAIIYYGAADGSKDMQWNVLDTQHYPVCYISDSICPAVTAWEKRLVHSIPGDGNCPLFTGVYKKGSYCCIPVYKKNSSMSILQLYSKNEYYFDTVALARIHTYTAFARILLEGKVEIQKLDQKASTDKLTGLYNRNYMELSILEQISVSKETNRPFSLIITDIDFFKKINDTYGHTLGDRILVLFAGEITYTLRKSDITARFGGEEFVVILPGADTDTAAIVAERIRQRVRTMDMPVVDQKVIPNISCSLGVATYPIHAADMNSLLECADKALYEAKGAGRNCTRVYGVNSGIL